MKASATKTTAKGAKKAPRAVSARHPGGRPSKYDPALHPKLAEAWAYAGLTEKQIGEKLGVSDRTIATWKNAHEEFLQALKTGKQFSDDRVERSLYDLANGYEYDCEKPFVVSDGAKDGAHVEIVKYHERIPPNPTAIIFWLKNRRPKIWRDKHEIEEVTDLPAIIIETAEAEK